MLREKSWHQQQAIPIDKDSAPLLPVYVERDPKAGPKVQFRHNPLTKFDL